jgi:hypothetical protein
MPLRGPLSSFIFLKIAAILERATGAEWRAKSWAPQAVKWLDNQR